MKTLKLSTLLALAVAFSASVFATDYTPLNLNVVVTSVSGNTPLATSISSLSLLAKINTYLNINGAQLVIDNTNGHVAVLDRTGALLKDLTANDAANNYYTNRYGMQLYVYASTAPWWTGGIRQAAGKEFTGGSINPNADVFKNVTATLRLPSGLFYIQFRNNYYNQTDFELGAWGGSVGTLNVSRTAAGVYSESFSGNYSGYWNGYIPNYGWLNGHATGTFLVNGTSRVPFSIWDPLNTY